MMANRFAGVAAAVAGVLFATYPLLRPYTEDVSIAGAEALASTAWVASHTFGMVGFILLLPVFLALGRATSRAAGGSGAAWSAGDAEARAAGGSRAAGVAVALVWLGSVLVLPYYGAETFALAAAGEHARATGDIGALAAIEAFRREPVPITMFGPGLLALGAGGAVMARELWRKGGLLRLGGLLTGIGLVTYLPQFFMPAAGRIGHGLLLGTGLVLLAVWLSGHGRHRAGERYEARAEPPRAATSSSAE